MGDPSLISGSGRSPGGGHSNPLQYSCLENPMDRGAWRAIVRGFTESETHSTHNFIPHLQPFSLEAKIDKGVKIYPWLGFFLCKRINQRIEKQLFRVRSRGDHVSVKWRCPLMTGNLTLSGSGLALSANLSFPSAELRARSHCGQSVPSVFQMAAGKQTCEFQRELSHLSPVKRNCRGGGVATLEAALWALIWGWTSRGEVGGSQLRLLQEPVASQLQSGSGFILFSRRSPLVAFSSLYLVKYLILQNFED